MEMFDLTKEQAISLGEAAKLLPSTSSGKKPSTRTIERWIRHGHRGVFLEGGRVGKTCVTSAESLQRFAHALTVLDRVEHGVKQPNIAGPSQRSPSVAKRAHERAAKRLKKAGWGGKAKVAAAS